MDASWDWLVFLKSSWSENQKNAVDSRLVSLPRRQVAGGCRGSEILITSLGQRKQCDRQSITLSIRCAVIVYQNPNAHSLSTLSSLPTWTSFRAKKSVHMFNRTLFEKSSAFLGGPVIRALFWGDMFL